MDTNTQGAVSNGSIDAEPITLSPLPPRTFQASPKLIKSTEHPSQIDSNTQNDPIMTTNGEFAIDLFQLPAEIRAMLARLPDDVYVPMGTLVRRAAAECWSEIVQTLQELSSRQKVRGAENAGGTSLASIDNAVRNDTSPENRTRKEKLWELAQNCRHILTKLHVLMQWSAKREENKLTIALNLYIHELRAAYSNVNGSLMVWIKYLVTRQDAAPDIDTAMQTLATGRVSGLPELGYTQPEDMTPKQMLSTLHNMNLSLQRRIVAEENLPQAFNSWKVRDGRISFHVRDEFVLDLSVMSEDVDAPFQFVNLAFDFSPIPNLTDNILNEVEVVANHQLLMNGLQGAYNFLHELVLTQKVKELHSQALSMISRAWTGHLQVEMIKRTLILQYWTQRSSKKSWVELTLNSGRDTTNGNPYIALRWMRQGSLVEDHDIDLNMRELSCEKLINQVVAQHANTILDRIYDQLKDTSLYQDDILHIDQTGSLDDASQSRISIELSKQTTISISIDSVKGEPVLSPNSERTRRLKYELDRSQNVADEFVKRFLSLRCGFSHANLLKAVLNSAWIYLPGMKLPSEESKVHFGQSPQRYAFFKQQGWPPEWTVVVTTSDQGDKSWLFNRPIVGKVTAQLLDIKAVHLQPNLDDQFLDELSKLANTQIKNQISQGQTEVVKMRSSLPSLSTNHNGVLRIELNEEQRLSSIEKDIIVSPFITKANSTRNLSVVLARFTVSEQSLEVLAKAGLDSSIIVKPAKRLLKLVVEHVVNLDVVKTILERLQYVHDLISCIRLVTSISHLKMRHLDLQSLTIDYHQRSTANLGLEFFLKPAPGRPKFQLLPKFENPHSLIADRLESYFAGRSDPLSELLQRTTSILTMTLPLISTLQYLQGNVNVVDVPEMKCIDLEEARKYIRVHLLVRDALRFGVQIFAIDPKFQANRQGDDGSHNMLIRLEILPTQRKNLWLIRPAVEEFKTYRRPSFTSDSLKQRMKDKILSNNDQRSWIALDSGVQCPMNRPEGLIIAIYTTVIEWLKEALASPPEISSPVPIPQYQPHPHIQLQPQSQSQARPQPQQQAMPPNKISAQQAHAQFQHRQQQHMLQQQRAHAMQGRGQNMNPNMQMGMNPNASMNNRTTMKGSTQGNHNMGPGHHQSRVMTAQPQQIRQPQQNQRRPGQNQARNNGYPRAVPGPQHDVINLD